ncbi:hypothetical protein GCM10007158_09380 [Vreelandella hamiltonii]|uniref:Uncharacterized protein n=1 Tax=Halomonas johnsoniae TaxID=502832 RepID=A0ABQ2WDZ1_9GAMM|nr:hypothetical protein GCM10007158_09380 [Halomonas johnsoniae]
MSESNERRRHPQRRPGAKGGASRPDYATTTHRATAHPYGFIGIPNGMLRGCAPLTPRYGYIAHTERGARPPVARRND